MWYHGKKSVKEMWKKGKKKEINNGNLLWTMNQGYGLHHTPKKWKPPLKANPPPPK